MQRRALMIGRAFRIATGRLPSGIIFHAVLRRRTCIFRARLDDLVHTHSPSQFKRQLALERRAARGNAGFG